MDSATKIDDLNVLLTDFVSKELQFDADMDIDVAEIVSALQSKVRKITNATQIESSSKNKTPIQRMQDCRDGLAILDQRGWNRSFHQRLFHEDFLVGFCAPKCISALTALFFTTASSK